MNQQSAVTVLDAVGDHDFASGARPVALCRYGGHLRLRRYCNSGTSRPGTPAAA